MDKRSRGTTKTRRPRDRRRRISDPAILRGFTPHESRMVATEIPRHRDLLGATSKTANFRRMKPKTLARILGGLFFLATLALALARHDQNSD